MLARNDSNDIQLIDAGNIVCIDWYVTPDGWPIQTDLPACEISFIAEGI